MRNILVKSAIFIVSVCVACTSASHAELKDSLSSAVKEKKLSSKSMEKILKEYDMLREDDAEKAREYVLQVVKAIEMGGDSSHIEVARKQVIRHRKI